MLYTQMVNTVLGVGLSMGGFIFTVKGSSASAAR
jgi:hypothetical protein